MSAVAQRTAALERAQEVRLGRAHLKRQLKAGKLTLDAALTRDCARTARVHELLLAVPGVGRVKAHKVLRAADLDWGRRVQGLSVRQRAMVAGLVVDPPRRSGR